MKKWIIGILSLIIIAGAGIYFFAPWQTWYCKAQDQPRNFTLADEFEPGMCWNPAALEEEHKVTNTFINPETGEQASTTKEVEFVPVQNDAPAFYDFSIGQTPDVHTWYTEEDSVLRTDPFANPLGISFALPFAEPTDVDSRGYPIFDPSHPVQLIPRTRPESAYVEEELVAGTVQPDTAEIEIDLSAHSSELARHTHPALTKLLQDCKEAFNAYQPVAEESDNYFCPYRLIATEEKVTVGQAAEILANSSVGWGTSESKVRLTFDDDTQPPQGNWLLVFSTSEDGAAGVFLKTVEWEPNISLMRHYVEQRVKQE